MSTLWLHCCLAFFNTPALHWLTARSTFWGPVIAIPVFFVLALPVEYGPAGVFLIPVTRWFLRQPSFASGVSVVSLLLAANSFSLSSLMPLLLVPIIVLVSRLELTLPRVKRLGYWFYPLYLFVLGGFNIFIGRHP